MRSPPAAACPIRVRDVATVAIGGELRAGAASENGQEVVIGTALMLVGENSRTVAAGGAANASDDGQDRCRRASRPSRCSTAPQLVDGHHRHGGASNLAEGALLVIAVLFLLLGNCAARR